MTFHVFPPKNASLKGSVSHRPRRDIMEGEGEPGREKSKLLGLGRMGKPSLTGQALPRTYSFIENDPLASRKSEAVFSCLYHSENLSLLFSFSSKICIIERVCEPQTLEGYLGESGDTGEKKQNSRACGAW